MNDREIQALIQGFTNSDPTAKKQLRSGLAIYLGLKYGRDKLFFVSGLRVYFQSTLSKRNLGIAKADDFYFNLKSYKANIGVIVAGVGYTSSFKERLFQQPDIEKITIHLLTLEDILAKTPAFETAIKDLQPPEDISEEN